MQLISSDWQRSDRCLINEILSPQLSIGPFLHERCCYLATKSQLAINIEEDRFVTFGTQVQNTIIRSAFVCISYCYHVRNSSGILHWSAKEGQVCFNYANNIANVVRLIEVSCSWLLFFPYRIFMFSLDIFHVVIPRVLHLCAFLILSLTFTKPSMKWLSLVSSRSLYSLILQWLISVFSVISKMLPMMFAK